MEQPPISARKRTVSPRSLAIAGVALGFAYGLLTLSGCSSGVREGNAFGSGPVGSVAEHPNADSGSKSFFVDPNNGGNGATLNILRLMWGRLVNVYDEAGELQQSNYVVREDIGVGQSPDYELEVNAVTAESRLTIKHLAGTPAYDDAFLRLEQTDLIPVGAKSLNPAELPPFPLVPRNAALVVQFDDLLSPTLIATDTIRMVTGSPPSVPFSNMRVFADPNHGDTAPAGDELAFYSTRAILDFTVSALEVIESPVPLQTNALGLPASLSTAVPNGVVRIPTLQVLPADRVLTNLSGRTLSFSNAQPYVDNTSPSRDVVRAFRSGGKTSVTNDPNNGFLIDFDTPVIVGAQSSRLLSVVDLGSGEFLVDLQFDILPCTLTPLVGDIIQQECRFAEVIEEAPNPPAAGVVQGLRLRTIFPRRPEDPCDPTLVAGAIQFRSTFDPGLNQGKESCFVTFSPTPPIPPAPTGEVLGVLTGSSIRVAFSEAMDPASVGAFDNLFITRAAGSPSADDFVVGDMNRTGDLLEYTFVPVLPFEKAPDGQPGDDRPYYVNLGQGDAAPTDLAGNPVVDLLPQIEFRMLASQPAQDNASLVFRFGSLDEVTSGGGGGLPEIRGQFSIDVDNGVIRPRPVSRLRASADRGQFVPGIMAITPLGVQTPLSSYGSKMQTVWRHVDVGLALLDETNINVDIEGLWWAPKFGAVFSEVFDQFEIRLSHSAWLPDELYSPVPPVVFYPQSGLDSTYSNNFLDPTNDPQQVTHSRELGYYINPALSDTDPSTGTTYVPFPLNRPEAWATSQVPVGWTPSLYTWRDTALQMPAGTAGAGADPDIWYAASGAACLPGAMCQTEFRTWPAGSVMSFGLPLLMEFRCYPTNEAIGLNGFDTNIAVPFGSVPNFRAFSTGGLDNTGSTVLKNPDLQTAATGGYNPNNNGNPTIGVDNTFYVGRMDLVTRVSRVYSIWFDTGSTDPTFTAPVVEPRPEAQPAQTSATMAFRGADVVVQGTDERLLLDACFVDPYGGSWNCGFGGATGPYTVSTGAANAPNPPTFSNGDSTWKEDLSELDGSQFVQFRVTFVANTQTGLTPFLSSLGIAFDR